jgi:hypothetical protein
MEDFLNFYYNNTEEIKCPLSLLLELDNGVDDVLGYIIEKEIYGTIFNIEELKDIKKSMINPLINEDNKKAVNNILLEVSKKYIDAIKIKMNTVDEELFKQLISLSYDVRLSNKELDIINKLKSNNVLKEYLPQVLENINVDLYSFIDGSNLTAITPTDIDSLIKDLSVLKIVMANIYYLIDNKPQLELRFSEKMKELADIEHNVLNKQCDINVENDICKDFIKLYEKIVSLEYNILNTVKELNNIKKTDLYDINDLYLNIVIKIEKSDIYKDDLYVFEKGQEVKIHEQKIYSNMLDKIKKDINNIDVNINTMLSVLNKINL